MLALLLFVAQAFAGPALVTTTRGAITLDGKAAPPAPFVLQPGQTLDVPAGGLAVVLYQGAATQVAGPAKLSESTLATAGASSGSPGASALDSVATRQVSAAPTGATRAAGGITLVRPVQGAAVLTPASIRWLCTTGCKAEKVEIFSFETDEVLWAGAGVGEVAYTGSALAPGTYGLRIGPAEFSFTVVKLDPMVREGMEAAVAGLKAQGVTDPALLASVPAAVYQQAGLHTEALSVLEAAVAQNPGDAALKGMLTEAEHRAGLR